jgi:phage/conjugal plasmid C-4 type zinc finger TraR family protein
MDEADIAQRNNEIYDRMAMQAHVASMPSGLSAAECMDCGAPIPEARRQAAPGCLFCLFCQELRERRKR